MPDKHDFSGRKFLVVDDEVFMLGMIERILRQFNAAAIFKAESATAALKSVRDNSTQVDCIISDYNMKPVNGLQFLQAVRLGMNPRIPRDQPFIMLTGHGETDVVKTAIMLDVNGYLVKPVAPDRLAKTLEGVFKKATEIKDESYYRSIKLGQAPAQTDAAAAAATGSKAWVILSKDRTSNADALKAKIERFKTENATRDGEEEVKIKNRRQCDLGELREDMILAEDIEGEEGSILLRKGTRLTTRMVDRLRELAVETNSRTFVWIGDLA